MNDFLIYAARLQDAGVCSLWVSLGSNEAGTRLMHVSPDSSTPRELAARYPTRTFDLCGTDRVLEVLKDDMTYSEGGATEEKVQAAISAHPLLADDLREWWELYKLMPPLDDDELEGVELDEAEVIRSAERAKGILRGLDIARQHDAMKTHNVEVSGLRGISRRSARLKGYASWPPVVLLERRCQEAAGDTQLDVPR